MLSWLGNSQMIKWLKRIRVQLQDQKLNRECVGQDRDGNKYYQYYSYYGLPTRRQIRFKERAKYDMKDLVYYQWLRHNRIDPPTEEEKQQFYLEQRERYEKARLWDEKESKLMEEFRKRREELVLRDAAMALIEKEMNAKSELQITTRREGAESVITTKETKPREVRRQQRQGRSSSKTSTQESPEGGTKEESKNTSQENPPISVQSSDQSTLK